jgi:hypothetical protein
LPTERVKKTNPVKPSGDNKTFTSGDQITLL